MELESSQSQEQVEKVTPETGDDQATQDAQLEKVLDLDSVAKFKYSGREMTPKDLNGMIMMQSDYTRKTQALAEERKYYDNLQADIDAVKSNPSLANKFREVYPEKFHKFLGYVTPSEPEKPQSNVPANNMDPQFIKRLESVEKEFNDRKIQAIESELDAKFSVLSKKYPLADEEAVIARAQALLERGEKITEATWDTLWKGVHDRIQKLADSHYSAKVNEQKTANAKGKDIASGGGTPGNAPKQPRTIREAGNLAHEQLDKLI